MDYPKNTINSREYKLKNEINIFNLKIEVIKNSVSFIINNLSTLDYVYKNKVNISSFLDILNISKENSLDSDLIFKKFDDAYKNKKILIHSMDKDNLNLEIENSNISKNSNFEIKLKKENMDINDKINLLYNEINLMKNMSKNYNNSKFENIQIDMNKKEDDIKNIINNNDININNKIEEIINSQKIQYENLINESNKFKKNLEEMNNEINQFKTKNDNIIKEFKIELEKKINRIKKDLGCNSFFKKIFLKGRKPINAILTNNSILDKNDIKIGSKIKIKCLSRQQEIEIKDYRFTCTDKYLNYTCIQIFNSEFEEDYFKEENNAIIMINKVLKNKELIEFKDLNLIYHDIEEKLNDSYFSYYDFGRSRERLFKEFREIIEAEKNFGFLSLMGIKILIPFERTNGIKGFIKAPENSPYKNGIFKFKIEFSYNYPEEPPNLFIETNIFHCNYHIQTGRLSIESLYSLAYEKRLNIFNIFTSLYEFFISNNPDSCFNYDIAQMYKYDRFKFEQTCKEYINKYSNYDFFDEIVNLFEESNYNKNDFSEKEYINIVYDLRTIRMPQKTILSNINNLAYLIKEKLNISHDFGILVGNMVFSSFQSLNKEDFSKISTIFIIPKIRCG